jgi:hypothetical protein
MTTKTPAPRVAYYLGRPAALWLAALRRRPTAPPACDKAP